MFIAHLSFAFLCLLVLLFARHYVPRFYLLYSLYILIVHRSFHSLFSMLPSPYRSFLAHFIRSSLRFLFYFSRSSLIYHSLVSYFNVIFLVIIVPRSLIVLSSLLLSLLFPYYSLVAHNISLVARYLLFVRRSFIAPLFSPYLINLKMLSLYLLDQIILTADYYFN